MYSRIIKDFSEKVQFETKLVEVFPPPSLVYGRSRVAITAPSSSSTSTLLHPLFFPFAKKYVPARVRETQRRVRASERVGRRDVWPQTMREREREETDAEIIRGTTTTAAAAKYDSYFSLTTRQTLSQF